MSGLRGTIVSWVDHRIDEMLACPRMWGSTEAVELQVLLLLEMRTLALRPSFDAQDPRRVIDAYIAFLEKRFPSRPASPLFEIVKNEEDDRFRSTLSAFRDLAYRLGERENPFERSQVAIRLTFKQGESPSAYAFTSYYEEFRRSARAASRLGDGLIRRARKDVEAATDFSLDDAEVSQPNGAAGSVLLRLGPHRGQQDFDADRRVRESLATMITMAEWAGSDAATSDLPIDDPDNRWRMAIQAMRLVPSRGISEAAIGGTMIGRSKPALFLPVHYSRFLEIVSEVATSSQFDAKDEVRAIDLDRGTVRLGRKPGLRCYVRPDQLTEVSEVGVMARVVGVRYQPPKGGPFVLANEIHVESSGDDA